MRACVVLVLLIFTGLARAGTQADVAFQAGQQALAAERFEVAQAQFEHARRLGYRKPDLDHALGTVYFRLGRLDEAAQAFGRLTRDPQWSSLGYYNLGSIEVARNNNVKATDWYQKAYQSSSNETLRSQAAFQLDKLGQKPRPKRLAFMAGVSGGHDSNVTVSGLDDLVLGSNSDSFFDSTFGGGYRLWGDDRQGGRLLVTGVYRNYTELNDFDQGVVRGGVGYDRSIGSWQMGASVLGETIVLNEKEAQRAAIVGVQASHPLGGVRRVRLGYEGQRLQGREGFEFLEGWKQSLDSELMFQWPTAGFSFGYGFEANNRDDRARTSTLVVDSMPVTVTEFSSFSPTRHRGYVRGNWQPEPGWIFRAQGEYQYSRYNDPEFVSVMGGGEVEKRRIEDRTAVTVSAEKRLARNWALTGDYNYTDNQSELESYDYDRHQVRMGLGFNF